jgi:hypothetical protein
VASASPHAIETGGRNQRCNEAANLCRCQGCTIGNAQRRRPLWEPGVIRGRRCTQRDFRLDPVTGGGDGPLGWYIVDVDLSEQFPTQMNASHIGFRLLVDSVWNRNIDSDDIGSSDATAPWLRRGAPVGKHRQHAGRHLAGHSSERRGRDSNIRMSARQSGNASVTHAVSLARTIPHFHRARSWRAAPRHSSRHLDTDHPISIMRHQLIARRARGTLSAWHRGRRWPTRRIPWRACRGAPSRCALSPGALSPGALSLREPRLDALCR